MYALLSYDETTVIACYPPDASYDQVVKEANGRTLIKMTVENSPAYLGGTYKDGKFFQKKGTQNA